MEAYLASTTDSDPENKLNGQNSLTLDICIWPMLIPAAQSNLRHCQDSSSGTVCKPPIELLWQCSDAIDEMYALARFLCHKPSAWVLHFKRLNIATIAPHGRVVGCYWGYGSATSMGKTVTLDGRWNENREMWWWATSTVRKWRAELISNQLSWWPKATSWRKSWSGFGASWRVCAFVQKG